MRYKAIVIEVGALNIIDAAIVDEAWFNNFQLPENAEGIRRVVVSDVVYLLSNDADVDSILVVLDIRIFNGIARHLSVLERCIRIGMRQFDRSVSIPNNYHKFHTDSLLSIFSAEFRGPDRERIVFDQSPDATSHLFGFGLISDKINLHDVPKDMRLFRKVEENYLEALAAEVSESEISDSSGNYGIMLSAPLGQQLATAGTLEEWLSHKLNPQQSDFVQKSYNSPIRLRGAAGTGKTQAMAVKFLNDVYRDTDSSGDLSFAFLTHSNQLAHEVIMGMFYAMDPSSKWSNLRTSSGNPKVWMGTIYELARDKLNYLRKGLEPLDVDGRLGVELQHLILDMAINQLLQEPRFTLEMLPKCKDISQRLSTDSGRSALIADLLDEFACTLDVEHVRKGNAAAEKYLKGKRDSWQMPLKEKEERELVLEIYDQYRVILAKEGKLSLNQMIADFDKYLQTHEWAQLREVDGFDVIFVDEYHYMNRVETMALRHLFKTRASRNGKWPLVMAYDLKQATNFSGIAGGAEQFRNPGVGASDPIDLIEVYRSTPEITKFLVDIDGSFPSMDLEGEYETYKAVSSKAAGDTPILLEYGKNLDLLDDVINKALEIAKKQKNRGRDVAVLCVNEELFDLYREAGRVSKKIVPIISRSDIKHLKYAKNRCVFSMPEYVAGLQFEAVFVIHVDAVDLEGEYVSHGTRRRLVTRTYLGASRAISKVFIACSRERGGPSEILEAPLRTKSLLKSDY